MQIDAREVAALADRSNAELLSAVKQELHRIDAPIETFVRMGRIVGLLAGRADAVTREDPR